MAVFYDEELDELNKKYEALWNQIQSKDKQIHDLNKRIDLMRTEFEVTLDMTKKEEHEKGFKEGYKKGHEDGRDSIGYPEVYELAYMYGIID